MLDARGAGPIHALAGWARGASVGTPVPLRPRQSEPRGRAHSACDLGCPHAYSVAGGLQAWQEVGLPVIALNAGDGDRT